MNSLQSSEKTPSVKRAEKKIEKYGFTLTMGIRTTTRKEWDKVYKDPEGNVVSEQDLKALADKLNGSDTKQKIGVDWELTGNTIECVKVDWARFADEDHPHGNPIELYATPEGPIMGIAHPDEDEDTYLLQDPCVVIYDGKGTINLTPIFNVADFLTFKKSAVRNIQVPNEILVALYPGFVLQNRMMKYQLRPIVPFVSSPELGNQA